MIDICCIGHITRDKIITPENTVYMNGGTSFYFTHGINNLPHRVDFTLITSMAEKDRQAVEDLRAKGVKVYFFPSKETVYFENKYGANPNHRTQRVLAKADPFTLQQLEGIEARFYHLGSLLDDDFSPELIHALSGRGLISIDAQGFLREVRDGKVYPIDWKGKEEVLRYTDILKLNEQEMTAVTGLEDPREVALRLAAWGVKEVVITLGSKGSMIYTNGQCFEIPAYPPKRVVDATGCGDTYSAGYLYCRAQGMSFDYCGRFAAAMCTLKLEHNGPFDATIEEVEAVIAQYQTPFI